MKMVLSELISVLMIAASKRSAITVQPDCQELLKKYYSINHTAFKQSQKVRLAPILSLSNLLKQGFYTQIVLIMKIVRSPYNPHRRTASSQT
jgi:hypothetical protein